MTHDDLRADPLLHALGALPPDDIEPAQAADLRSRCHVALARRRWRHAAAPAMRAVPLVRLLEPALIGGACVAFLSEVIRRAAALYGF